MAQRNRYRHSRPDTPRERIGRKYKTFAERLFEAGTPYGVTPLSCIYSSYPLLTLDGAGDLVSGKCAWNSGRDFTKATNPPHYSTASGRLEFRSASQEAILWDWSVVHPAVTHTTVIGVDNVAVAAANQHYIDWQIGRWQCRQNDNVGKVMMLGPTTSLQTVLAVTGAQVLTFVSRSTAFGGALIRRNGVQLGTGAWLAPQLGGACCVGARYDDLAGWADIDLTFIASYNNYSLSGAQAIEAAAYDAMGM